jgi:hypothetical protein
MYPKLLGICSLVAALALSPSMSSASPVLTEGPSVVAVGKKIVETNTGDVIFDSASGPTFCNKSERTGTVTVNSGGLIGIAWGFEFFGGTAANGGCTSGWLASAAISSTLSSCFQTTKTSDQWELRGGNCSEAAKSLTFTLKGTFAMGETITCKYSRSNVTGTFSTNTTPVTLTVGASQSFTKEEGSFICPSVQTLTGKYTLETDDTSALLTVS